MFRNQLLARLEAYQNQYPSEDAVVGRMESFVLAHADCFERSCRPGHITGSAWLLNTSRTHTLLTHHRKLDRWLQLGGHSDGDPDTLAVAMREACEESGLAVAPLRRAIFDLDIHEIPARGQEPAHLHYDVRFVLVAQSEAFTVSPESKALRWVGLSELQALTKEESVLRMARKTPELQND